jgi:hypothetical protein
MDHAAALEFADHWVRGWNAHDIEQVLSHFAGDAVFTSPVAVQLLDGWGGLVSEVLTFDGDLVTSGHGTYLSGDASPAGATSAPPG